MPARLGALLCATVLCTVSTSAAGTITLALSSPDDLQSLSIGTPVTINVSLSGVEPGQTLSLLGASVAFDGSLFSLPTIAPGTIVPDPLSDPLDFLSTSDTGLADASFFTFSALSSEQISQNGEFYSFAVTPIQEGNGVFEFTFVDAGAFDPDNPDVPAFIDIGAGLPLAFQIAVPEPSTAVLAVMGAIVLMVCCRRRFARRRFVTA
jgi:hypothetical protein